jgi:indole-3-acetate monooxygenase
MVTLTRTSTETGLLTKVEELAPFVREHSEEAERERHLSRPVFEAMVDARLFHMFVPRELGGLEVGLVEGFEAIERLSEIDSAAGWNLQISAVGGAPQLAPAPDAGIRELFSDPRAVVVVGFSPPGAAVPVDGGYRLSGRWPFVSGCQQAFWIGNPALRMKDGQPELGDNGEPILMFLVYPMSEAQIIETWDPLGMRGTGSHDVVADDVFVPESHTAPLVPDAPNGPAFQGPLYRLGVLPVFWGNAVVALGIARAAIDEGVELAKSKIPALMQARPVDRGVVQAHLARAEAKLCAARAYFYATLSDIWDSAVAGERPSIEQRVQAHLAASFAAEASAEVVDHIHAAVGSSGVREEQHRFARHFRDVHTISQHATCSAARFESMGQIMLGLETDWAFFHF